MRKLFFIIMLVTPCISYLDEYNEVYEQYNDLRQKKKKPKSTKSKPPKKKAFPTTEPKTVNMSDSYYPMIVNDQRQAKKVNDPAYPAIASVVDSISDRYLCTAACIEERIFITAARCIADGPVLYTYVMYQNTKLTPIACVLPLNKSKQMFDDIGLIVVKNHKLAWKVLKVTNKWKRTSQTDFKWFAKVKLFNATAVGHVARAEPTKPLYEIDVHVSNYFCYYLYNRSPEKSATHFVPCYHTCTFEEEYLNRQSQTSRCKRKLAGEGHIVLDEKKEIVGVATWGPGNSKIIFGMDNGRRDYHEMPIGMAIPNSDNFIRDLECARRIKKAPESSKAFAHLCKPKS